MISDIYFAYLTKNVLNACFCDLFIFKFGMLVNGVELNHRWEYCLSVGLGMWLIFAFFKISLLFRGSLWDLHEFISGRFVGLVYGVMCILLISPKIGD